MTAFGWLQFALYLVVLVGLAKPLGAYMADVYEDRPGWRKRLGSPVESSIYRLAGVDPSREMRWIGMHSRCCGSTPSAD
jgi:K+-transporting ATPase ATPase A chain